MEKKKNRKRKVSLWMQLLISIIGTAIGVGLTFAVNNWMDNRKSETQEMLDSWVHNYKKETLTSYQKWIKEGGARTAGCVHLDASRDKMELKIGENAVYFKREK